MLIPTTALSYGIGNLFFSEDIILNLRFEILNIIFFHTRRYLIGNFIVAAFFTIISYFIVCYLVKSYYKRNSIIYKTVKAAGKIVENV